jgi:hypothetical protein
MKQPASLEKHGDATINADLIKKSQLLDKLQQQAATQAYLEQISSLPKNLEKFIDLIIYYPWQTLLFFSLITSLFVEFVLKYL